MPGLRVEVERAEGVRCPRCWHVTPEGRLNHDHLCDRCCAALLADWPEYAVGILAAKAAQRGWYRVSH